MSASCVEGLEQRSTVCASERRWNQLRLQLDHEVRLMEQFAKNDCCCWFLERGTVSSPRACQTRRVINHEHASRSQSCWRSKDSQQWNSNFRIHRGRIAIGGSFRWNVNKYAAVAQMDLDGDMTPWCGVGGFMSISLKAQRTIKVVDIWAFLSPCVSCAGHHIFSVLQEERRKLSIRARWIVWC